MTLQEMIDKADSEPKKIVGNFLLKRLETDIDARNNWERFSKNLEGCWSYIRSKFGNVYDFYVREYVGYIDLRKELKLDIKSHSARFPSDLEEAYRRINESLEKFRSKEERRVLRTMKTFIEHLDSMTSITDGTYSVVHPRTRSQFVKLGNTLNNCVGSMGYYDSQAHGKCAIFGIKKDGKLYACLELIRFKGKTTISQLYLKDNQTCDKATRSFVQKNLVKKVFIPQDTYRVR